MEENKVYTIGYIDYNNNEICSNDTIYKSLDEAISFINLQIIEVVSNVFDIYPQNKFLFSHENINLNHNKILQINSNKNLIIIKKDLVIDLYFKEYNNYRYIYRYETVRHFFKFFINTHYDQYSINSSSVSSSSSLDSDFLIENTLSKVNDKEVKLTENKDFITELSQKIKKFKVD